jgi:uncharacterized protein (TIGR00297 family)
MQIVLGFALAVLISWLAYRIRALDRTGFPAAVVLGGVVFSAGGLTWSVPLLAFFISSSLWTRLDFRGSRKPASRDKKRGRTARQVLANSGPALLAAAAAFFQPEAAWPWWCYLGSLAAVTADTWATEIGPLFSNPTFLITSGKKVPAGTSGGVSLTGTLASMSGAGALAALAGLPASVDFHPGGFGIVLLAGLTGSLLDSWLGATVQRRASCPSCGKDTEQPDAHPCRIPPDQIRGIYWMTNEAVNLCCAAAGGIMAPLLTAVWLP